MRWAGVVCRERGCNEKVIDMNEYKNDSTKRKLEVIQQFTLFVKKHCGLFKPLPVVECVSWEGERSKWFLLVIVLPSLLGVTPNRTIVLVLLPVLFKAPTCWTALVTVEMN